MPNKKKQSREKLSYYEKSGRNNDTHQHKKLLESSMTSVFKSAVSSRKQKNSIKHEGNNFGYGSENCHGKAISHDKKKLP